MNRTANPETGIDERLPAVVGAAQGAREAQAQQHAASDHVERREVRLSQVARGAGARRRGTAAAPPRQRLRGSRPVSDPGRHRQGFFVV